MSRASLRPSSLEMFPLSLKNLALCVLAGALVLAGCGQSTSPEGNVVPPGTAKKLAFTAQPQTGTAGAALPAVRVSVQDETGKLAPTAAATVSLTLKAPDGVTLSGAVPAATALGVATFSNLSLTQVGEGYTLVAHAEGFPDVTSASFAIQAGPAKQLAFEAAPSGVEAGGLFDAVVRVAVRDAFGNPVKSGTAVTVALGANPVGGTLSGTLTATAVDGVASFPELSLDKAGDGYTLVASAQGLDAVTSPAFRVRTGKPQAVVFVTQPSNATAGVGINPAVSVRVVDSRGNTVTDSNANVTMALAGGASGAALSGTSTVVAVNGVATFANLSVDKVGQGYTLVASSDALTGATSNPFNVLVGAPKGLVFNVQPSNAVAGAAMTPAPAVSVVDAFGNTVTNSTLLVSLALGTNPGAGTLSGTVKVNAVAGVATFPGLSINKSGTGYTLVATITGLPSATSAAFNVSAGAATTLTFVTNPPTSVPAGAPISPAVQVAVSDANGNPVTGSSANITLSLSANPGGSTLGGTLTVASVNGVATFADITLNKMGSSYRFQAAATGLTSTTSSLFNVVSGAPAQLAITTQPPASVSAGATFTTAVTVRDVFGNTVTNATQVSLAIGNNPVGGTLGGTTTVSTSGGVATFSNLTLNKPGTGYTLVASSGTLASATSTSITVAAGPASQLAFTTQPTDTAAGATISPAVQVSVRDAGGNLVTGSTASITVALGNNPGGGSLGGTLTVTASGGVATFSTLSLTKAGANYTLSASATGLTGATSSAFSVTPGAPTRLAFTVQPSRAFTGKALNPAVQVALQDTYGNAASTTQANVTVALGNNPGGATLSGTFTVATSSGVATFADLSLDAVGNGYTLTANTAGLPGITSAAFNVVQGGSKLIYVDPAGGKIALVRNPASTDTTVVLDLVSRVALTGYSVGMNLPLDSSYVLANASLMTPGAALPAGTAPTAAYGKLPSSGPLAGVLSTGQSQKAAGPGAVVDDSPILAGTVFYTVRLDLNPAALTGVVFDGAALGAKFRAMLRTKAGTDVVNANEFAIGRLEVR